MLTVGSYNLLAPLFVQVEGQPYSYFAHAGAQDLAWSSRRPRIEARLRDMRADVLCLQEVELEPSEQGRPWQPPAWLRTLADELDMSVHPEPLSDGDWRRQAARNGRKAGKAACAGLMTLVSRRLEPVASFGGHKNLSVRFELGASHLTVVNVHLEGAPSRGAARVKQLRSALARARRDVGTHVLVIGDWNTAATPDTPVGKALTSFGMRRVELGPSWVGAPANPRSVDQILHDPSLRIDAQVDLTEADLEHGMPNPDSPSDHAPLIARLEVVGPAPAWPAAEPAAASPAAPALEASEAAELSQAWRALEAERPDQPKGPPSAAVLEALRDYKAKRQAFLASLPSDEHRSFVKKL